MSQLTINIPVFREAFALAASWASKNKIHATMQCVLIESDGEKVTLKATNGENSITVTTEGAIGGAMRVLVHGEWFGQVINKVTDDECVLFVEKNSGIIRSTSLNQKFPTQSADEFPVLVAANEGEAVVKSECLAASIRSVIYACDQNATNYAVGGALFEFGEGILRLVATGGNRMSIEEIAYSGSVVNSNAIVPADALRKLSRALGAIPGDCRIASQSNIISVSGDGISLNCRLLEGRFPQWRQMAGDPKAFASVNAGALLRAVDQAALSLDDLSTGCQFVFSDGALKLGCQSKTLGESTVTIPVAAERDATFSLKAQYVIDCLRHQKPDATVAIASDDWRATFKSGTNLGVVGLLGEAE